MSLLLKMIDRGHRSCWKTQYAVSNLILQSPDCPDDCTSNYFLTRAYIGLPREEEEGRWRVGSNGVAVIGDSIEKV
jgi:hypothetical protein